MKTHYSYFALISKKGESYNIHFPDLEGCYSCAESINDVAKHAQEALELWLYGLMEDDLEIPAASSLDQMKLKKGEAPLLVTANMALVCEQQERKSVKKTLSIPLWLNRRAEKAGINFSQTLQEALKEKLML